MCASGYFEAVAIASADLDHDVDGRTIDSIRDVVTAIADAFRLAAS